MKYLLLFLFSFSLKICHAQTIYGSGLTLNEYETFLHKTEPLKYDLYQLTKEKKYDSIITICKIGIKNYKYTSDESTYQAFLASTYYLKGKKDSAYSVALNFLKEKSKGNWSIDDIINFSNYLLLYPLATDVNFQKKILDLYIDDYKKRQNPNTPLGVELLRLHYLDQRIRQYAKYGEVIVHDSMSRTEIKQNFMKIGNANDSLYMAIVKRHPQIIKESEVGDAFSSQFILLHHITNNDLRENILLPMLKTAMDKKEIEPDTYVEQLTRTAWLNKRITNEGFSAYTDSLCKIYHCIGVSVQ